MATSLVPIEVESIYQSGGKYVNVPARMAKCTPDFKEAILHIRDDVKAAGAVLRLSDLFRTYDDQMKAYQDYKSGKKKAYSPPPGSSFHEAGRAMDVDVAALKPLGPGYLERFWKIAAKYKVTPIISTPDPGKSECWHFECLGEFVTVKALQGYKQAVRAAILDVDVDLTDVKDDEAAWVQGQILAYGKDIGPIDGIIGQKTKAAIQQIKQLGAWPGGKGLPPEDDGWEQIDQWLKDYLISITTKVS